MRNSCYYIFSTYSAKFIPSRRQRSWLERRGCPRHLSIGSGAEIGCVKGKVTSALPQFITFSLGEARGVEKGDLMHIDRNGISLGSIRIYYFHLVHHYSGSGFRRSGGEKRFLRIPNSQFRTLFRDGFFGNRIRESYANSSVSAFLKKEEAGRYREGDTATLVKKKQSLGHGMK